jgi:hypothetical protein
MSPVRQSRTSDPRAVAVGVGGVVLGLALLLLVVFLAIPKLTESGTVTVNLGSRSLALGHAEVKAQLVAESGPIFFQDPSGGDHDLFIQHVGPDPKTGWIAFDARPPGTAQVCDLKWDAQRSLFVNPDRPDCKPMTFPADGGSLQHYQVTVDSDLQLTLHLDQPVSGTTPATAAR